MVASGSCLASKGVVNSSGGGFTVGGATTCRGCQAYRLLSVQAAAVGWCCMAQTYSMAMGGGEGAGGGEGETNGILDAQQHYDKGCFGVFF